MNVAADFEARASPPRVVLQGSLELLKKLQSLENGIVLIVMSNGAAERTPGNGGNHEMQKH